MGDDASRRRPLAGLGVIERGGPGPMFLGRMLVDLGAEVMRVERRPPGFAEGTSASARAFQDLCANGKRLLVKESIGDLLPDADVLLDDGFGGAEDMLREERYRRLIWVTISPFGASGPFAERPSSDLVTHALSGYLHLTGPSGGAPVKSTVVHLGERNAAGHALAGLLLALRRRRMTGLGCRIDVSTRDALVWMLVHNYQYWDLLGVWFSRRGSIYSVGDATRNIPSMFPCRDGHVVWLPLAGRSAAGTAALVRIMHAENMAPHWLVKTDWTTFELPDAQAIQDFLAPFEQFFLRKTGVELLHIALQCGAMLAPVTAMSDVLRDPQLEARQAWVECVMRGESVRLPRAPFSSTHLDWSPPRNRAGEP